MVHVGHLLQLRLILLTAVAPAAKHRGVGYHFNVGTLVKVFLAQVALRRRYRDSILIALRKHLCRVTVQFPVRHDRRRVDRLLLGAILKVPFSLAEELLTGKFLGHGDLLY